MINKLVDFKEYTNEDFGSKANNLSILLQNGFKVPHGLIIPATTIQKQLGDMPQFDSFVKEKDWITHNAPHLLESFIRELWDFVRNHKFYAKHTFAIRSSANLEDGTHTSFAGMFTSVLNIQNFDDFSKGFIECMLSKYNDSVVSYCRTNNINPSSINLNLIVQQMVDADYSGVCFSLNPLTGNAKEMVIESIAGLGENLVQGLVSPNRYLVNWYDNIVHIEAERKENAIPEPLMKKLIETSLEIQKYYGNPQDIEWAIKNDELYILQVRPLTAIHFDTDYDWTNADLKDGGIASEITTPFMYSLYEYAFESTMPVYLDKVKLLPDYKVKKWFTHFLYYSYWNISATKDGLKKIPGFVELEFDNDLGIEPNYEGKGHVTKMSLKSIIQGIRILFAIKKSIKNTVKKSKNELALLDAVIEKYRDIEWEALDDKTLIKKIKTLYYDDYLKVEGSYFNVIYDNSNNTTLFKDFFAKKNKKNEISYLKLITGLQNLSHLQPSFSLWEMSRKIIADADAFTFFTTNKSNDITEAYIKGEQIPFRQQFDEFIEKYGFHSEKELSITEPNWDENPKQVFDTICDFVLKEDAESIIEQNRKQKKIFDKEFSKIQSKKLKKAIENHRYLLWLREEYRDRSSQMYHIIRRAFLNVGKILLAKNKLKNAEDVFFLEVPRVIHLLESNADMLDIVENNQIIYRSFRNFDKPNEIFSHRNKSTLDNTLNATKKLSGIACSFGVVEGEVYIAKTVNDAKQMPAGKIMLTKFTDPAWTVYFSKITGLITETGGMLSHGAIISREYGIPAVLGVKNASSIIKNGDTVRLDGSTGEIHIL